MKRISGINLPHNKNTAQSAAEMLPVPTEVHIPMSMHIGAPAKPVVHAGDDVKAGQLIGEADGLISSPVHASVSGKVKSINDKGFISGLNSVSVTIESDGRSDAYVEFRKPIVTNLQQFLGAVRDSGVVGLGGAGFPTAVKLTIKDTDQIDYILVNGAECEPYITSDTRMMVSEADFIFEGVQLMKRFIKPKKVLICIEGNKPEAISKMKEAFISDKDTDIRVLPAMYPQGGEKVLIYNVTGRIVPEGALPLKAGCIVVNCSTVATIARYIELGIPLLQKVITVDGAAVKTPKNVIAPIGAPIGELFEYCGGFVNEGPIKVLSGGPMMGALIRDLNTPVIKTTGSVLAFPEQDIAVPKETACIRCGRCINKCPMRLMPVNIEAAVRLKKTQLLKQYKADLCIECGCCAYICPAKRPLLQAMQLSKEMLKKS